MKFLADWPSIASSATADQALRIARSRRAPLLVVHDPDTRQPSGYVRVVDIYLRGDNWLQAVRPLPDVPQGKSPIGVALEMQRHRDLLARVVDDAGRTVGILDVRRITESFALGQ
jgi:CBS domain containing-hemolysin-like protein